MKAARLTKSFTRAFSVNETFFAKDLVFEKTQNPKEKPGPDHTYVFGDLTTDHMLEIDWNKEKGWGKPLISPYHNLSINPANSTLHYALECFEGMKGYPHVNGKDINLFRPLENMKRFNRSFEMLAFPSYDNEELSKCIAELVRVDKDWMPKRDNMHSIYIRPTGISMENTLGVKAASDVKLFVIMSPVGPYYPQGFKPVSIYATKDAARAWHGGNGDKKLGANYGPTIKPANEVIKRGYDQILWLVGDTVSEVGTMNFFIHWINDFGEKEIITCPLDGTILPGVTRSSTIDLCKSWGFKTVEEKFSIGKLIKACKQGRVLEAFGTGTAAIVTPVKNIGYQGIDYNIPIIEEYKAGEIANKLVNTVVDIQTGKQAFDDWALTV